MSGEGDNFRDARTRELFIEASELASNEEREEFLKQACADDPHLLEEVTSLLSAHNESHSLMELDLLSEVEDKMNGMIGSRVGRYHVLEKLGEGGFGEVFRVEQTEPIQRELALKIIKPGMDSRDVIRRFESERQALARLDHSNIAQIIDAGATDIGRPYFVMELVCGQPITKYCDQHNLSIDERLELFRQVCEGVQHAHQKGIIHRDLNPNNIIVVEKNKKRIPKIIDFGIAKSLQGHLTGKTILTQRQFLVGTPEYMSPEQFIRSSSELDHRTDIYSLGSVLNELVSGTPPINSETMSKAGISEIHRIYNEDEPEKPSTRLRTVSDTTAIAEKRGTTLSRLDHKLRGDLDRIIMKCLEKDRIRRYESVNDLDQDLKAFLECRPVQATTPSVQYRIKKLIRRKRNWIAYGVGALLPALIFGCLTLFDFIKFKDEFSSGFNGSIAQQLLEIERLKDKGKFVAAFALAKDIVPHLPEGFDKEEIWKDISWSARIVSKPSGALVYRQHVDASEDEWEELGPTPLESIRFPNDAFYRIRIELSGYRTFDYLVGKNWWQSKNNPKGRISATLDTEDNLPDKMVRLPGFTMNLVDYGSYYMDQFEVTNREYAEFVLAGGYETPDHWSHPFVKDGRDVSWEKAIGNFVDSTGRPGPSTWIGGTYVTGRDNYPVSGISWYEAAAYAKFRGKELPPTAHHNMANRNSISFNPFTIPRSNLLGNGARSVGENRAMNSRGIYDLYGNVREWCWNSIGNDKKNTKGGAWTDAPFHITWDIPESPWKRDPTIGFRLVQTFDEEEKLALLREPITPMNQRYPRDYSKEQPVSNPEYQIYRRLYSYDPHDLDAEVVAVDKFEHWTREAVEFNLPYGERGGAYIFLPKNYKPPFKTVVYWPGSGVFTRQSIEEELTEPFDFIVRSGIAVAIPIFKGAYYRDETSIITTELDLDFDTEGTKYRDYMIKWVQDLSTTIDYLYDREDIDVDRIAYYGFSFGAMKAPIVLAIEDRIKAAVLNCGGLCRMRYLPETDPLNFIPHVRTPVLMLNGEYDPMFPLESSQKPMFELLGTAPEHKKFYTTTSAHSVPREVLIRETLEWFDRYLNASNSNGN